MTLRSNDPMTPNVKEDKAFANWFRDWIAVIQPNCAFVERFLPENRACADGKEYSEGAHLFGPKRRAPSGRAVR